MHIRYGYRVEVAAPAGAEVAVMLDIHPDQRADITQPDAMRGTALGGDAAVDCSRIERDRHGNLVRRITVPDGGLRLDGEGVLFHSGFADPARPDGRVLPPRDLPTDVLPFLLASACCPTAALADQAWSLFRHLPNGWGQVEAICEYVHQKLRFAEGEALARRPADEVLAAGAGSIADFAHVGIAFCRALDIPARYCTGYLPGSGEWSGRCEGGFCAWFEAYLDGEWRTFDAWHPGPRVGRILVGRGLDAVDAPIIALPVAGRLLGLSCFAEPVEGARYPATAQDRRDHWQAWNARNAS